MAQLKHRGLLENFFVFLPGDVDYKLWLAWWLIPCLVISD